MKPRIGCIGLGRMGLAMAARFAAADYEVCGFDVRTERQNAVEAAGIRWMASVAAVVAAADLVVNCVTTAADVTAVIDAIGPTAVSEKKIFLETTTLSPREASVNAARLAAQSISYLDCPISGGEDGASSGALTLMVGGANTILDEIRAHLTPIAKHVFHLGEIGDGSRMKAIVQATFLSHVAAFLEALSLGRAAGIPFNTQLAVIAETTAHHPTLGKRYAQIAAEDFSPRFEVLSALKDLAVVEEVARDAGTATAIIDACRKRYELARNQGFGAEDMTAVLKTV
jgi:3-hydroxyisobutyrate dehydrogenase